MQEKGELPTCWACPLRRRPRGQIIGDTHGLLKLVFAPADKTLLGVHIVGEMASELIHIGAHVMAEAGTIDAFIQAVYDYPTLSNSYKYAAYDGRRKMRSKVLSPSRHPPSGQHGWGMRIENEMFS